MSLFFQEEIRRRCVPSPSRPATDLAEVIRRGGTIYCWVEDPYASASPLMTAVAEHVLDTALGLANMSRWGRLCPPLLACLDELPSTAPLPTLRTRMANERALGISFIYAAQTWRQLAAVFGEQEARALFGLTNVLVMFGGSKDGAFNQEISDLVGQVRVTRRTWQTGAMAGAPSPGRILRFCGQKRSASCRNGTRSSSPRTANRSSPAWPVASTASWTPAPGRPETAARPASRKMPRGAYGRGPICRRPRRGATSRDCG